MTWKEGLRPVDRKWRRKGGRLIKSWRWLLRAQTDMGRTAGVFRFHADSFSLTALAGLEKAARLEGWSVTAGKWFLFNTEIGIRLDRTAAGEPHDL